MIKSAIIPAAGLGTRMTPYSKEIPKEMLPIIIRERDIIVEPVLHFIFSSLYDVDVRYFFFIVGRGKRIIEDYFTPDWSYVEFLRKRKKYREANILEELYHRLDNANILMINQPYPYGFGDAILRTRQLMVHDSFFVHAGDDITYPNHIYNLKRLIEHYETERPRAVFLYTKSRNPQKYGVIIGENMGNYIRVKKIIEKPRHPPSVNTVVAVYIFDKKIYEALNEVKPTTSNKEHQLTDAINLLIDTGEEVHAIPVIGIRLDMGDPNSYYEALSTLVNYR